MTVFESPYPDVPIPDVPLTSYVFAEAATRLDQPALIDGPTGRVVTYGAVLEGIRRFAGGLQDRGIGKGDVVAVMLPNLPEYAVVFHGIAVRGAAATTLNPTYTPDEVGFQLRDAGARLAVTLPMFLDTMRKAAATSPVEEIVVLGEAEGATPLAALLAAEPFDGQVEVDPARDPVVIPYSSGTTGLPKGVVLTHRSLVANLAQVEPMLDRQDGDVAIAVLPFFHIYGMEILMNGILWAGSTAVTMPRFDLDEFLRIIQDHHVTHAYLVPPIILALAKHPAVDAYDLSSLRIVSSGAAPLGADLADAASQRIACEVVQGYGLTETSPVTHATPPGHYRPGSVGFLVPNTRCRVVDPVSGEDLGVGEDGELWIRGPQVMREYLNAPEATAATIVEDGWLRTGDIGHVDEDGYWYVVDRLKELIKYKGFQVAPAELEDLLLAHPAVADAGVVGKPDEEAGEVPVAFVVLHPGAAATAEELQEHVAEHVAPYKRLAEVRFVGAIPKSLSGKILRRVLKEQL